ncbi:MAG: hypothetical protein E6Q77_06195 [Rhizobium sp.]|nr:MAG: hypothetical protein E6Q77_06195 [Rhizobium sp.]
MFTIRPDLILQPGSAAQIGAGRCAGECLSGHFYLANRRTFQLSSHMVCKGYLVMRQLGQLEMRQSRLSTHWSKPTLRARMTIFSLVETMSGWSRHVLFNHHVAERIASPRTHPEDP